MKKKLCFHTGASVLITDAEATVKKLKDIAKTFSEYEEEIEILWCADGNVDIAIEGRLGSAELKETYYSCVEKLCAQDNVKYFANPSDEEMKAIAQEYDAYYGDNGFLMGLFINEGKPVMKMDL